MISFGLTFGAAVIGSLATAKNVIEWYPFLVKPEFNPPGWIFGPVWTALYVMMAMAFYLILTAKKSKIRGEAIRISIWQLVLNAGWSVCFFGLKSPETALVVIVSLWLAIAAAIYFYRQVDKRAAVLMIPYLLWVSFATVLNYSIVALN